MKSLYYDDRISIRVSNTTPSIDRKYLEAAVKGTTKPVVNSCGDLIGIDIQF